MIRPMTRRAGLPCSSAHRCPWVSPARHPRDRRAMVTRRVRLSSDLRQGHRGLNDAVQTDEFGNDELAHTRFHVRPRESPRQGGPTTATQQSQRERPKLKPFIVVTGQRLHRADDHGIADAKPEPRDDVKAPLVQHCSPSSSVPCWRRTAATALKRSPNVSVPRRRRIRTATRKSSSSAITQAQAAGYRMDAVYRPRIRDYIIRRLADRKYQEKQADTSLVSSSQSLCDENGVGGLLAAPDLAVSPCPEVGESGLYPPPLLRDAEIVPENDHVIARLEVLVPFRVELVEVGQEWEEISDRRVETAIDAPVGESFGNIVLDVIRQERFERIHVSHGGV